MASHCRYWCWAPRQRSANSRRSMAPPPSAGKPGTAPAPSRHHRLIAGRRPKPSGNKAAQRAPGTAAASPQSPDAASDRAGTATNPRLADSTVSTRSDGALAAGRGARRRVPGPGATGHRRRSGVSADRQRQDGDRRACGQDPGRSVIGRPPCECASGIRGCRSRSGIRRPIPSAGCRGRGCRRRP